MTVIEAIKYIEHDRRIRNRYPISALLCEIAPLCEPMTREEVKKELNKLYRDGIVDYYRTINDVAFTTKQTEEHGE